MLHKLILLTFITTSVVAQQESTRFSLKEAAEFAIQNNYLGKNAARDVEIAELQKMANNVYRASTSQCNPQL